MFKSFVGVILAGIFICSFVKAETLILIGGGKRPPEAMKLMTKYAEGGPIVIIAWASEIPEETATAVAEDFLPYHHGKIEFSLHPPKDQNEIMEFRKLMNSAKVFFFTGGDQSRILKVFLQPAGKQLRRDLQIKFNDGIAFGGTSAGTAIMSQKTIVPYGENKIEVVEGLGLLTSSIIVDQHFTQRNREARLKVGMGLANVSKGIGVDEHTALILRNGQTRIVGEHLVRFFQRNPSDQKIGEVTEAKFFAEKYFQCSEMF